MDALKNLATSPALLAALKEAASRPMTPAEQHAQRRSWVIGQLMLSHPEMSRDQAAAHADKVLGPNLAARVAELEAENARLTREHAEFAELVNEYAQAERPEAMEILAGDRDKWRRKVSVLRAENARLRIALHDAIRRPLGVTPDSAAEFYDQRMADEAEERRSRGGRL